MYFYNICLFNFNIQHDFENQQIYYTLLIESGFYLIESD